MSLGVYIPARTKSQRLPNKLLLPLGDTNLFEIACEKLAALPKKYGRYALICEEPFIEIADRYNINILYRDPETIEIDGPIVKTMGAVAQAKETHMMFLNPCLAFLSLDTIENALWRFETEKMDYATSVKPFHNWIFTVAGKAASPIDYKELNTKAITGLCQAAHCFHIFNRERFLEDGMMLHPGHGLLRVPEKETVDVDTEEEYLYVKWMWENGIRG